jgi:hypothetical protein
LRFYEFCFQSVAFLWETKIRQEIPLLRLFKAIVMLSLFSLHTSSFHNDYNRLRFRFTLKPKKPKAFRLVFRVILYDFLFLCTLLKLQSTFRFSPSALLFAPLLVSFLTSVYRSACLIWFAFMFRLSHLPVIIIIFQLKKSKRAERRMSQKHHREQEI